MIFLLCQIVAAARFDSVVGRVRDEDTGVGLARVRVVLVGTLAEANTGPGGRYALARLSARLGHVRFTLLGYQPLEVQIASAPGQVLLVDVDLRPLAQTLPPIEVTGRPVPLGAPPSREAPVEPASDIGRSAWTRETLATDPLRARDDPFASVAAVAAATMQPDFPSTLQVRGGAADQNLVLVDGACRFGSACIWAASPAPSTPMPWPASRSILRRCLPGSADGSRVPSRSPRFGATLVACTFERRSTRPRSDRWRSGRSLTGSAPSWSADAPATEAFSPRTRPLVRIGMMIC